MLRDEYFRRLVDEAYIELYLSSVDGARIYWPWRMQPPKEASMSYRNACEQYIIDSDPLDDSVTTKTVLDTAFRLDAEVASLADVYQDKDATVNAILNGFKVYDDHQFNGDLLIPLQEPFDTCWKEIGEPTDHLLGIGGLKDATNPKRIDAAKTLRSTVGKDVWIHGFGWGVKGDMATAIRKQPNLIDSIDYSTPIQTSINGIEPGEERMSVQAMYAATKLVRDLREVTPYINRNPQNLREKNQLGLDAIRKR